MEVVEKIESKKRETESVGRARCCPVIPASTNVLQYWLEQKYESERGGMQEVADAICALEELVFKLVAFYPIQALHLGLSKANNGNKKKKCLHSYNRSRPIYTVLLV